MCFVCFVEEDLGQKQKRNSTHSWTILYLKPGPFDYADFRVGFQEDATSPDDNAALSNALTPTNPTGTKYMLYPATIKALGALAHDTSSLDGSLKWNSHSFFFFGFFFPFFFFFFFLFHSMCCSCSCSHIVFKL